MLGQAKQYLNEDPTLDPSRYLLLRADVGRLPFATGSGALRRHWLAAGGLCMRPRGSSPLTGFVECPVCIGAQAPMWATTLLQSTPQATSTACCLPPALSRSGGAACGRSHPLLAQPLGSAG